MNDDGSAQVLVRPGRIAAPAWSPDGTGLGYSRSGVLSVGDLIGSSDVSTGGRSTKQAAWRPVGPLPHGSLPEYADPDFESPSPLPAATVVSTSGSGDFNGDGLEDVVLVRQPKDPPVFDATTGTPMPLGVLEDDGKGHLVDASAGVFGGVAPGIIQPVTLVVADFDEDAAPDIFVGSDGFMYSAGIGRNRLFLSTGDGHEVDATANLPLDQSFTWTTSIADVNGDGHLDLFGELPLLQRQPATRDLARRRQRTLRGRNCRVPGNLRVLRITPIPQVPSPMSMPTGRPTWCSARLVRPAARSCC